MDTSNFWWQSAGDGPGPGPDPGDFIGQSLRFRGAQILQRESTTDGNRRTWTWSGWTKKTFDGKDSMHLFRMQNGGSAEGLRTDTWSHFEWSTATVGLGTTSASFRDPTAWYHVVVTFDSTQSNQIDRVKFFVNGVRTDIPNLYGTPLNGESAAGGPGTYAVGGSNATFPTYAWEGYIADVYFIDGQALEPTAFGRYNTAGVWVPDDYDGTYGINGFHLTFDPTQDPDPAVAIGMDSSGNDNHFTSSGFEVGNQSSPDYDLMQDSPTQNWSTYNPLYIQEPNSDRRPNFINANLGMAANNNPSRTASTLSTIGITQNVYAEVHVTNGASTGQGPAGDDFPSLKIATQRDQDNNPGYEFYGNQSWSDLGTAGPNGTDAWTTGDVVRVAIDYAGRTCQIAVNNGAFVSSNISGMTEEPWTLACKNAEDATHTINYGQQPFIHTPPAGFEPLQTQNLPAAPIPNGRDHFRALTGPGQGADGTPVAGQTPGNFSEFVTLSTGGFQAGFGPEKLFDGNQGNDVRPTSQSATVTWAPDGGFAYTSSVDVFIGSNTNTCKVFLNGTEEIAQHTRGWNTVDTGSGTINSLAVGPSGVPPSSGVFTGVEWGAIRVDGNILVDFGILALAQQTFPQGLWWIKDRVNSNQHQLVDSVRGATVAFNCPGKTNGTYVAPAGNSVAWCWSAPDAWSANVGDNGATLASSGRRNLDAGFSIATYTGNLQQNASFNHGLNRTPEFAIIKNTQSNDEVMVHQQLEPAGTIRYQFLSGNGPSAPLTAGHNDWNDNLAFMWNDPATNANGSLIVAYYWHSIPGYSAFGSYQGNSSTDADGPFIYTGFRPAWIMIKCSNINATNWVIDDAARSIVNPVDLGLQANEVAGESSSQSFRLDFLSNGFKVRSTGSGADVNRGNLVYAAFAENPFGANNVSPANAR